jgi:hypothetical protein
MFGGVGWHVTHHSALDGGEFSTYAVGVLSRRTHSLPPTPCAHCVRVEVGSTADQNVISVGRLVVIPTEPFRPPNVSVIFNNLILRKIA